MTGGRAEIYFTGDISNTQNSYYSVYAFLKDGHFVDNFNNVNGFRLQPGNALGTAINPEFTVSMDYLTGIDSGAHTFCFTMATRSTFGGAVILNDNHAGNIFYVKEIK
jgi:hypothetical protein